MDLLVLGIVWRLDLHCRRASGHVALGSIVDHSCMPTGMRELSLPQASTEVCMSMLRNVGMRHQVSGPAGIRTYGAQPGHTQHCSSILATQLSSCGAPRVAATFHW